MTKSTDIDMCHGTILPKMLVFALPLMASSVMQLLFNAADIAVIGNFGSEHSLAAIGATPHLVNLLVNFFTGLTIGANVLASMALGARDVKKVRRVVHTAVALSFVAGGITAFLGLTFAETVLIWMQTPEVVLPLTLQYTRIYFMCMVPTAVYNFGAALLYAKGDTKRPLMFLAVAGVINVILNLVFVLAFNMDVAGVAWATLISQIAAALLVLNCLARQRDAMRLYIGAIKINRAIAGQILRLGLPAGLQGVVFSLSNLVIQSAVNSFGPVVMAGSAASANLEGFVWVCMNAFQQTATTFLSRNIGARQYGRIDPIRRRAISCACLTGIILGGFVVVFGRSLLGLYTNNVPAIEAGYLRLSIICGTYFTCGVMDVLSGSLRGLGESLSPAVISLIGACGLRLLWIATYFQIPENHTVPMLFYSYPMSWVVTAAVLYVNYLFVRKRFPKESVAEND